MLGARLLGLKIIHVFHSFLGFRTITLFVRSSEVSIHFTSEGLGSEGYVIINDPGGSSKSFSILHCPHWSYHGKPSKAIHTCNYIHLCLHSE